MKAFVCISIQSMSSMSLEEASFYLFILAFSNWQNHKRKEKKNTIFICLLIEMTVIVIVCSETVIWIYVATLIFRFNSIVFALKVGSNPSAQMYLSDDSILLIFSFHFLYLFLYYENAFRMLAEYYVTRN